MNDNYIKEQRKDLRILSSVKKIAERGDLEAVLSVLEKKGADLVLSDKVQRLFNLAVKDYVKDNTGGSVMVSSITSPGDILDKEDFGKNYWGKYLKAEIDNTRSRIIEKECHSLSAVYC